MEGKIMLAALYYPHTRIKSKSLLKTSLLLWDRLEFIIPDLNYHVQYDDKEMADAVELIGTYRCPDEREKREVHERVEEFATRELPPAFYYHGNQENQPEYAIYAHKFSDDTWRALEQLQLAKPPEGYARHRLAEATGLTMMSLLAECCAGTTRTLVTDRGVAYANLINLTAEGTTPTEGDYDVVVPITLSLVNTATVPLNSLIEFRKREAKSKSRDLRDLRHRYVKRIEDHVDRIRSEAKPSDRKELQRLFEEEMKSDLAVLKNELGTAKTIALTAQDVIVGVMTTGAFAASALFGAPLNVAGAWTVGGAAVTLGGMVRAKSELAARRKEIMRKHPMAYMYELERFAPFNG
jgi:hypothetical protein